MSENNENNDDNHIKIFLRIKKEKNDELNDLDYFKISNDNKNINITLPNENKLQYSFDKIFNKDKNQKNIFEDIGKPLCLSFMKGFNSTIISYGKKNSGKTYALLGKSIHDIQKEFQENGREINNYYYNKYLDNKGIIIFCLEYIFNSIILNTKNNDFIYNISMSFIDVFDNHILDYFNVDNYLDNKEFNLSYLFKKKDISNLNFTKLNISTSDEALLLLDQGLEIKKLIFDEININDINGH